MCESFRDSFIFTWFISHTIAHTVRLLSRDLNHFLNFFYVISRLSTFHVILHVSFIFERDSTWFVNHAVFIRFVSRVILHTRCIYHAGLHVIRLFSRFLFVIHLFACKFFLYDSFISRDSFILTRIWQFVSMWYYMINLSSHYIFTRFISFHLFFLQTIPLFLRVTFFTCDVANDFSMLQMIRLFSRDFFFDSFIFTRDFYAISLFCMFRLFIYLLRVVTLFIYVRYFFSPREFFLHHSFCMCLLMHFQRMTIVCEMYGIFHKGKKKKHIQTCY